MSDSSVVFVADRGDWGFFTGEQPTTPTSPIYGLPENVIQDLSFVHVEGLEQPVQFSRVRLVPIPRGEPADHVVVSLYPPVPPDAIPGATRRLLRASSPAALCFVVEDEFGWARATSVASSPPQAVAAAVAHSKIVGGWDESDPIVVTVDGEAFQISGQFEDGSWRLAVARAW